MTWLGPMRVVDRSSDEYTIQSLVDGSRLKRHVSSLKPFLYPDDVVPEEVAARDRQEFLVEAIIDHEPSVPTRTTGQFLVRWAGYDASHDTWESYTNLCDNEFFHDYCFNHNLLFLIPKSKQQETLDRNSNDLNIRTRRLTPTHVLNS